MSHKLFTLASAGSLLLCLAVCMLWCRSHWRADYLRLDTNTRYEFSIISRNGGLQWKVLRQLWERSAGDDPWLRAQVGTLSLGAIDPHNLLEELSVLVDLLLDPLTVEDDRDPSPIALRRFMAGSVTGTYPGLHDGPFGPDYRCAYLVTPYWALVLPTGIAPAFRAAGWWRGRRRAGRGFCFACGYDLRATRDRCPECGRTAA